MELKKSDRVRNPTQPSWGLGVVLDFSGSNKAKIRFRSGGEKVVDLRYVSLEVVTGPDAEDPFLDLPDRPARKPRLTAKSFDSLVEGFLRLFPGGFLDPSYIDQERNYKVAAHRQVLDQLSEESLRHLLAGGYVAEVKARAMKAVDATNLVFPNEKIRLKDGLKSDEIAERFARGLFDLLYGGGPMSYRFERYADALHQGDAAKWTIATYFLFFRFPSEQMFLKPVVTQNAADLCGFDLAYRPELNWRTYERLLAFSQNLKERLVSLKPRDMIDVQSFIWVTGGDYQSKRGSNT